MRSPRASNSACDSVVSMVALLIADSNKARSSRSNSAAVRTRMPAALSRQRAASGKNGSCRWSRGNCFSTIPHTNTTGSTHWRASSALRTWTTLRRPSVGRSGFSRSTDFTVRQNSSIPIARASAAIATSSSISVTGNETPKLRASGRNRFRNIRNCTIQSFGAISNERHSSMAPRASIRCISRSAPGLAASNAFNAPSPALGICSRTAKSKRSMTSESANRGARRRTCNVRAWSHPPSMASTAPLTKRTAACRSMSESK